MHLLGVRNSYTTATLPYGWGASIAGDANVVSGSTWFSDMIGNPLGIIAQPPVFYPTNTTNPAVALYRPSLNDGKPLLHRLSKLLRSG
jgi:hypothetical protein